MAIEARQIADALKNNESIATAIFALIDQDEDAMTAHPDITVRNDEDGNPDTVEYDGYTFDFYRIKDEGVTLLTQLPAEVQCGFGRPLEITLTGGGPTEWIEAKLDSDGDVFEAVFRATYGDEDRTWRVWKGTVLYRLAEWFAGTVRPQG